MDIFKDIAAIAVPALLSGGGVWTYMAARHKAKQEAPAAMLAGQAQLGDMLNAQTKLLLEESAKDRRDLKRRIDRQGQKITKLETRVSECQDKHSQCEANLTAVRDEINKLMAGPVAGYVIGEKANVSE